MSLPYFNRFLKVIDLLALEGAVRVRVIRVARVPVWTSYLSLLYLCFNIFASFGRYEEGGGRFVQQRFRFTVLVWGLYDIAQFLQITLWNGCWWIRCSSWRRSLQMVRGRRVLPVWTLLCVLPRGASGVREWICSLGCFGMDLRLNACGLSISVGSILFV